MDLQVDGLDGVATAVMLHPVRGDRVQLVHLPYRGLTIYLPAWRAPIRPHKSIRYDPKSEEGVLSCQRQELNLNQ
jgi:hypothetical protein